MHGVAAAAVAALIASGGSVPEAVVPVRVRGLIVGGLDGVAWDGEGSGASWCCRHHISLGSESVIGRVK